MQQWPVLKKRSGYTRLSQIILTTILNSSEISSIDLQLSENTSPQEVPSSPVLKRAKNSLSDLNSPFYTKVENDCIYQVSIDHDWEETPVNVVVPKVTVKRILPSTGMTSKHKVRFVRYTIGYVYIFCLQENLIFQGENQLSPKQTEMV